MKNQEQIIAQVLEILDNLSSEDITTGIRCLECSQGPFSTDYLIRKGYFTQEVADFCLSIDFAQENTDAYCLYIEDTIDEIKANPKDWHLDDEEIASFEDQDYAELAEADGWVFTAYEHLLMKIFQEVKNDLEA
jgi:hypothetical protein